MEDLPGTRLLFDDEGTPFPEPKKKVRKQTKSDMTFEQALNALQTTHTLSTRMICELLKTYRPWVTKYILPKLDKIYLNNGKKGTSRKSFGINWVYMAAQALENEEITVGQLIDEKNYSWIHISLPFSKTNQILHLK